jgi:hypothetical protein
MLCVLGPARRVHNVGPDALREKWRLSFFAPRFH